MLTNKLYLNGNHTVNPSGSIAKARNVRFNDDFEFIKNEEGLKKLYSFPADICGIIPTDRELIVFCTNNNGDDYIYRVADGMAILSLKGNLQFSTARPIKGEYQYNNKGELIVVFNDGNFVDSNSIRVFNFDSPYIQLNPDKTFINANDINLLKLNPDYILPDITANSIRGGSLPKGVYHVVFSYYVGKDDRLNWSVPSKPIYIEKTLRRNMTFTATDTGGTRKTQHVNFYDFYQDSSEEFTDKGIYVELNNLDIRFTRYKLAIVYRTDTTTKVFDIGDFASDYKVHNITSLPNLELSLDEVSIPYVNYDKAADITISNSRLTVLGTKSNGLLNYQKFANNIKVTYDVTDNIGLITSFSSLIPDQYGTRLVVKTPILDEVYALNIGLVGKDGTVKGVFHIPGRAPELIGDDRYENSHLIGNEASTYNKQNGRNIDDVIPMSYYYQLHNTAAIATDQNRRLGYWENRDEYYPNIDDFEVWDVDSAGDSTKVGDLRGLRVRHHKMPDFSKIYTAANLNTPVSKSITLTFTNIKFPKDILSDIQGYFITYSNRDSSNSTVLGHGPILRNNFWKPYSDVLGTDGLARMLFGLIPNPNFTNAAVRFNDFALLSYKPSISSPYLKGLFTTNPTDQGTPSYGTDTTVIKGFNTEIRNVLSYKYVPRNNSATEPDNTGREEALLLHVPTLFNDTTNNLVCSLKSNLANVFMPFNKQRVSIASNMQKVTSNIYAYEVANIKDFDGFISFYYNVLYRGDQSLKIDEDGDPPIIIREDGDEDKSSATVVNAFKCLNISTANTDMKSISLEKADVKYIDDRTFVSNIFGKKDYTHEYKSTFVVDPSEDSNIVYNKMYGFTNSIVPYFTYDFNNIFIDTHPYRIARSAIQSKESLVLNWRFFSALEYYEMPKHRGIGVSIEGQGNLLLIHMEHSLFVAKYKDKISIAEGEAYIGTSDIFDRIPDEILSTKRGTAGIQSRFGSCIGDFGYMFADTYDKNVYSYGDNSFGVISDEISRALLKKYMNPSTGNPLIGKDVIFGIDHSNKRAIITSLGDTSFSISYCYHGEQKGWLSFHDYVPALMVNNRVGTYMINRNNLKDLYKMNADPIEVPYGTYFDGVQYDSYIDVLVNDNPKLDKTLLSVGMQSGVNDEANNIKKLFIYTRNQCTNVMTLSEFNLLSDYDKIRYLSGFWNYDLIRDYTSNAITQNIVDDFGNINIAAIDNNKNWFELGDISDKYFIIRLIANNNNDMLFRDITYNAMINRR
jgi:hypothetical protein